MCIAGLQSSYTLILIRSISIIYLYLKIHNQTGYKYLGKTIADPHKYEGSGKLWKRHINKHGYDVKTKILFQTEDKEEFKKVALKFSKDLNIVESKEFANLVPEQGDGGAMSWHQSARDKLSKTMKGRKVLDTTAYKKAQQKRREEISLLQKKYVSNNYESHCDQLRKNANYEKISKSMSKLKWCNDSIRNYRKEIIPEGFSIGKIKHFL